MVEGMGIEPADPTSISTAIDCPTMTGVWCCVSVMYIPSGGGQLVSQIGLL